MSWKSSCPISGTLWERENAAYVPSTRRHRRCSLCAAACPTDCIYVEAAENTDEDRRSPGERYAKVYDINMLRCIFCGLCEEACPKDAIYLSETFAPANFQRKGFIYGKDDLLIPNPVTEPEAYAKAKGNRANKNN